MAKSRPNFLVIVADDLGYSDIGCYGSEIKTPNIDALAAENNSLRFTSYYVAAACAPTRAMLMTGVDHHLTGLGQLPEIIRLSPVFQGAPGHEGYLVDKVVTLPEILNDAGYFTCMAGKWHLGMRKSQIPSRRGFDKSFALLAGAANHYGFDPLRDTREEASFDLTPGAPHSEDGEYVKELPEGFYSSDYYAEKIIGYLQERVGDEKEKPFFAYLPFTAPHWPLQAPKEAVDMYKGVYGDGPAALRLRRMDGLRKAGIIPEDVVPHEVVTSKGEPVEWEAMESDARAKSARAMETYAGMVTRMDENIGKIVDHLKRTGEYENTHILFMSDNGAEGHSHEATPMFGSKIVEHIHKYYNNSLENIGRADSFAWYGTRWAQAATAPSRLYKMYSTEGGCRVPLVMKQARQNSPHPSAISDTFVTVQDLVPTILSLAGVEHPAPQYKGREVHAPDPNARSWAPFLDKLARSPDQGAHTTFHTVHSENEAHGWEVSGSGGLRRGRYKIVYVPKPKGPQEWQLYDIVEDQGEVKDLKEEKPELFQELLSLWEEYQKRVGVVGLAGHMHEWQGERDEFEDDGAWNRVVGKNDEALPQRFR